MSAAAPAFSPSPFIGALEPITASDDELRAVLDQAELPPLLPALAYATGDRSLLRPELMVDPLLFAMPNGGLEGAKAAAIRRLALEALVRFRDGGGVPAPPPNGAALAELMSFAVGGADAQAYVELLDEELACRGVDPRAPGWTAAEVAPGRTVRVGVIGAGFSGLLACHRLTQAGVDCVVFEKNDDLGGTWFENRYPGCRVDNPNHTYSYSFAQRVDWPYYYSPQPVLLQYLRDCVSAFGITDRIRLRTEVLSAQWSDDARCWRVEVRSGGGTEEVHEFDALVSAVGQLNRPKYPTTIPGFGSFAGPAFHSARWDSSVELAGKRVAVIGTGASAMQFVPEIAGAVGELLVFQRTPAWMGPSPNYHRPVSEGMRWLYHHVPSYASWNRFCTFWRFGDGAIASVTVDPSWDGHPDSVSAMNEFMRQYLLDYLNSQFADRPDLLEACTPHYPIGAKRIIQDNGVWAGALKRPNVRVLDGGGIRAITPQGIVTADGVEEAVDVIIYGTGFEASKFLAPMQITGRGGVDLHEQWAGDARAYLGVTIPGFPNLFCLYGPNTNIVINGSIVYFTECGVRYLVGLVRLLLERGARALDVRRDVHDEFNERVDAENRRMTWGASRVNSWYRNQYDRVSQNWPFTLLEYWQRTKAPVVDEYEVIP